MMPIPARSLHGFMAESEAVQWLTQACILNGASPNDLWRQGANMVGAPVVGAGAPEILDLPASVTPHLDQLTQQPWFQSAFGAGPLSFKLVEIDPLLAFQFTVSDGHSAALTASVTNDRSIERLVEMALPLTLRPPSVAATMQGQSLVLMSDDLNFAIYGVGQEPTQHLPEVAVFGPQLGTRAPAVQVGRFNGRYYLRNGYHRTYGARLHGATHVPCLVLDFTSFEELTGGGFTFSQTLMESAAPPTMGHHATGRSCPVQLRAVSRVVTISWTNLVLPEAG